MRKDNCVFCKIVDGQIPSYKVYEDEDFFGFLTIKPHTKGHTLLIPKNHFDEILVTDDEVIQKIFTVGKKIGLKIKQKINPDKVAFIVAGQGVPHLHLHLIPMNQESDLNPENAYEATKEELVEAQEELCQS